MSQINKQLILLILISITLCLDQNCKPFGLRLSYGEYFSNLNSYQKLVIRFNTQVSCPKSYITLSKVGQYSQILNCQENTFIITSETGQTYQPFIHTCSIDNLEFNQNYVYMAYGKSNQTATNSIAYSDEVFTINILDPQNLNDTTSIIYLADWGFLKSKAHLYDTLNQGFKRIRQLQEINGLIINGDIAYDLNSNNCQNYVDFLNVLTSISVYTPIIYVTGNHEKKNPNANKLFRESFSMHHIDQNLATGLRLGSIYLTPFDPYNYVYNQVNLVREQSNLQYLSYLLKRESKSGRFIIPSSHYPMKCTAQADECHQISQKLNDYFELFYKYGVSLYIGAHVHTYERTYPFYQNGSYVKQNSPYDLKKIKSNNLLLSIIQGVAGGDNGIIESYDEKINDFTVNYTFNETGFGLLKANQNRLIYSHYSCKGGLNLKDEMIINLNEKINNKDLLIEMAQQ